MAETNTIDYPIDETFQDIREHRCPVLYDTIPPKVEYALTDNGAALLPALNALYQWGTAQMARKDTQKNDVP